MPNDFRDHVYRKCLKRTAIPSIFTDIFLNYPAQYESSASHNNNNGTNLILPNKIQAIICRLCRDSSLDWTYDANDIDIMISKCFPNLSLDRLENMPICENCITKLKEFSHFIDKVMTVQNDLHSNVLNATNESLRHDDKPQELSKPTIIIKQEPVVNVKQEIIDSNRISSNLTDDSNAPLLESQSTDSSNLLDALLENDAFCEKCDANFLNNVELKKHIVNFHSSDHRGVSNNCEIMEIITLENGCIDLVIEEEEEENVESYETYVNQNSNSFKTELTTEQNQYNLKCISIEHNYSIQIPDSEINIESIGETNRNLFKQEENQIKLSAKMRNPIDLTETSIIEETKAITILTCSQCNSQFDCQHKFDEHIAKQHSLGAEQENHFKCLKCLKIFDTEIALFKHKLIKCCSGLIFKCRYCKARFRKWRNMRRHSLGCSKVYQTLKRLCRKPVKNTAMEQSRKKHIKSSRKSFERHLFSCDLCGRSYNRRCNLVSLSKLK